MVRIRDLQWCKFAREGAFLKNGLLNVPLSLLVPSCFYLNLAHLAGSLRPFSGNRMLHQLVRGENDDLANLSTDGSMKCSFLFLLSFYRLNRRR